MSSDQPVRFTPVEHWSDRDLEILQRLVDGQTDGEIAYDMGYARADSVQKRVQHLRAETGCANRGQLIVWAIVVQQMRPTWAPGGVR